MRCPRLARAPRSGAWRPRGTRQNTRALRAGGVPRRPPGSQTQLPPSGTDAWWAAGPAARRGQELDQAGPPSSLRLPGPGTRHPEAGRRTRPRSTLPLQEAHLELQPVDHRRVVLHAEAGGLPCRGRAQTLGDGSQRPFISCPRRTTPVPRSWPGPTAIGLTSCLCRRVIGPLPACSQWQRRVARARVYTGSRGSATGSLGGRAGLAVPGRQDRRRPRGWSQALGVPASG